MERERREKEGDMREGCRLELRRGRRRRGGMDGQRTSCSSRMSYAGSCERGGGWRTSGWRRLRGKAGGGAATGRRGSGSRDADAGGLVDSWTAAAACLRWRLRGEEMQRGGGGSAARTAVAAEAPKHGVDSGRRAARR
ncbi:hypothetical protein Scep_021598 [Stephania cephalantha]|uniref:Uncharacterized protein n=1 Tax=Stephania cephalantha TaxID=152367 RepID=A0AAP0FE75_9MAGN